MNLIFLYGPPATGKYTVGCELAALTGYRFFHNHLVVDTVLSVYDFGTPGFVELRETIWIEVFSRAAQDQLPGLIFTFNPENSVRQSFIDWLFNKLPANVYSVQLTATENEIERRLSAPSRHEHKKLTDLTLYRHLRESGVFQSPSIPRTDIQIDTAAHDPITSALVIANYLAISPPAPSA
jgi:hypothetical protein